MCVGSNKQSIIIFFSPSASASHAMVFLGRRKREEQACSFSHIPRKKKRVLLTNHARTKQEEGKEEDEAAYKSRKQINQHGRGVEFSNFYSNFFRSNSCYGNLFVLARSYKKSRIRVYFQNTCSSFIVSAPTNVTLTNYSCCWGTKKRKRSAREMSCFPRAKKKAKKVFPLLGKLMG